MSETTSVGVLPSDLVWVRGTERVDLLQRLSTNDLRPLREPGRVISTVFTNEKGRIVDWCWLVSTGDALLARTSPGRGGTLRAWIDKFTIMEDVTTEDAMGCHVSLVAQGPRALPVLALDEIPAGAASGIDGAWWWRGLAAYGTRIEGVVPRAALDTVLGAARAAGAESRSASDEELARLAAGVPSPAAEFEDEVNPLELRLKMAVSWSKGCYVGQEVIARLDTYDKVARYLIGFEGRGAGEGVTAGARLERDGRALGTVTSCAQDADGRWMGLAVVKRESAAPGDAVIAGMPVRLLDRPFWTT